MLKGSASKTRRPCVDEAFRCLGWRNSTTARTAPYGLGERARCLRLGTVGAVLGTVVLLAVPSPLFATHEADHRFTVEGYVCGTDGKGSADVEVLIKDTRISYGQTVKTNADGYYTATFHLHNENLGDPLLVEARGETQQHKVQFDPKDLEAERKIQVHFGSGCTRDPRQPPQWVFVGLGAGVIAAGGFLGLKLVRASRKHGQKRGKGQGKRRK